MRRVAIGEPAVIALSIYDDDGNLVDATGNVSVTIEDGNAEPIVIDETATKVSLGTYTLTLPDEASEALDVYTVEWSGTVAGRARTFVTRYEVVGNHYFEISDIRAFSESIAENPSRYTAAKIREARDTASERLETECVLSFTPRLAREIVKGAGRRLLVLPHNGIREIYAVEVDGVALTEEELDELTLEDYGVLAAEGSAWYEGSVISIAYGHGLDAPEDSVKRAAMILAVDHLVPSAIPARAMSESTDLGTIRYSIAGRDGATGIPDVDAVIKRYGRRTPVVG